MKSSVLTFLLVFVLFISCKRSEPGTDEVPEGKTPVTITHPEKGTMSDVVELNATSSFLIKTSVKSDINGYLQKVDISPGQKVNKGQILFTIRSKEAEHLGNTITQLDTTFRFNGSVQIKSPVNGYITQLSFSAGDYVQDGENLATISNINSLVFLLELPYELTPYLDKNKHPELVLPDGRHLEGTLESSLPTVNLSSQTQSYMVRVKKGILLPENLVAKVEFIKKTDKDVVTLPKEAVLSDESQSTFWIMKMINSSTAVKVPIEKGIETDNKVQITSPSLQPDDTILLTGNYGLPDTANVIIENRK